MEKSPTDFATDVDLAAERAIVDVLCAARPTDRVEGEELGTLGAKSAHRTWLVDPLCGTLNFAAHTPLFAVNVALLAGAEVAAAASADPLADEVFWTDGRHGYVRRGGTDEGLVPSSSSRLIEVNLDPPYPNGDHFRAVRMLADSVFVASFGPRVVSTTLAVAWVAAGRRAVYVTDGRLRGSVHFASGVALCEAAGCIVTGLRGQAVHTGAGGLVVAADEQTHAALITIIDGQFTGGPHPEHPHIANNERRTLISVSRMRQPLGRRLACRLYLHSGDGLCPLACNRVVKGRRARPP